MFWGLALSRELTNATSICQPLDQGIIKTFKAYYKRKWLAFLCDQYDADKYPFKNMHILQAIRWSMTAWEYDVKPANIVNCWIKSLVFLANYFFYFLFIH